MPTFLQTVRAVAGFLDRAAEHCAETGVDPDDFVNARLFNDMAPFHFQVEATWHHSVWGVEALKTGVFAPPALVGPVVLIDDVQSQGGATLALVGSHKRELRNVVQRALQRASGICLGGGEPSA